MNIYLLSGLGADDWIYRNISFPEVCKVHFIPWLEPKRGETLTNYVQRLSNSIDISQPFVLCGISFGGICAQEMTRFLTPEKLILISTITGRDEKPAQMNLGSDIGLSHLMPAKMFKWAAVHSSPALGINQKDEVEKFKAMSAQFSADYYKWAVSEIGKWKGYSTNVPVLRMHGDKDKVFPVGLISEATIIEGGEHIMAVHQGAEVSALIDKFLDKNQPTPTGGKKYQRS
jgi:pimeloyl-ACP methyl ester carboxylesterase